MTLVLDLRTCGVGVSCEEYTTLMVAGNAIPPSVQGLMDAHAKTCEYHRSSTFHQSALGTPVTKAIETAAAEIIAKYQ